MIYRSIKLAGSETIVNRFVVFLRTCQQSDVNELVGKELSVSSESSPECGDGYILLLGRIFFFSVV